MSDQQVVQQKSNTKLQNWLKTEKNRLAKLNALIDELRLRKNEQNRRLANWLTDAEYRGFLGDWESDLRFCENLCIPILAYSNGFKEL